MKVVLSVILMLINVNLAFSSIEGWTEACIGTSDYSVHQNGPAPDQLD